MSASKRVTPERRLWDTGKGEQEKEKVPGIALKLKQVVHLLTLYRTRFFGHKFALRGLV